MSAIAVFEVTPRSAARVAARLAAVTLALWAVDALADPAQPSLEISAATLPRFDNLGGATHSSRVDFALQPHRDSGFGFAVGVNNAYGATGAFLPNFSPQSSVDLGVRWRYTLDSNYRFDVTAYRRVQNSDAMSLIDGSREPSYGARVEMGLASNNLSKGFVADRGFIGFQLESGARLTVKKSGGVPMLYYRNTF
jgi:hypothetical protein